MGVPLRLACFTQPDPSGQETNPYLYAADGPINHRPKQTSSASLTRLVPPLADSLEQLQWV
ncbi:hypothetical protein HY68_36390 [Streptomyces sp. AcH 505]|nr:hypothetical protein HY68_36390 [Streptomyces sp. AcH 505]